MPGVRTRRQAEEIRTLKGHTPCLRRVLRSRRPGAGQLPLRTQTVRVWDAATKQECRSLQEPARLKACASVPDGPALASLLRTRRCGCGTQRDEEERLSLQGHTGDFRCVCFSSDSLRWPVPTMTGR